MGEAWYMDKKGKSVDGEKLNGYDKQLGTITDSFEHERTFKRCVYANDMPFTKTMHKD